MSQLQAPHDGAGDVIVIIPALNEEDSIASVLGAIPRDCVREVVVVDNGSTDGTAEVARRGGATVLSEPTRGYGHACMAGIRHAARTGGAVLVFLDGDYSDYPEELPLVAGPVLRAECDLVIGSRMTGEREPGAMLPQAVAGNWLASTLIRIFWGYQFTDLGPFRAVTMEALHRMHLREMTFGWTVEMQIRAAQLGMRCREVPVRYRKRIGHSKVTGTFSGTIRASVGILRTIARAILMQRDRATF